MKDERYHYEAEESEEAAKKTVEKLTAAGPRFACPYIKAPCEQFCFCSVWPYVRRNGNSFYSHGYYCSNRSFTGER